MVGTFSLFILLECSVPYHRQVVNFVMSYGWINFCRASLFHNYWKFYAALLSPRLEFVHQSFIRSLWPPLVSSILSTIIISRFSTFDQFSSLFATFIHRPLLLVPLYSLPFVSQPFLLLHPICQLDSTTTITKTVSVSTLQHPASCACIHLHAPAGPSPIVDRSEFPSIENFTLDSKRQSSEPATTRLVPTSHTHKLISVELCLVI